MPYWLKRKRRISERVASSSSFGAAAFAAARPAWGAEGSLGQRPNVPGAGKIPMKT